MYKTFRINRDDLGDFLNKQKESQDGIDIIYIDPIGDTPNMNVTLEFFEMPDEIAFHVRSL